MYIDPIALFKRLIEDLFTPPEMPPDAYARGIGWVPGVRSLQEIAWQVNSLHMLGLGICVGAVMVLTIFVAVLFRIVSPKALADHLRGIIPNAHAPR